MLSTLPVSPSPPSLNGLFCPAASFKRTSPHDRRLALNSLLPVPLTALSLLAWHALFRLISWWMLCLVSIGSRVYAIGTLVLQVTGIRIISMLLLSYMPHCPVSATLTQFLSLTASPTLIQPQRRDIPYPQSRSHQLRRPRIQCCRCPIPPVLCPVIHRLDGRSRPLRLLPFHLYHRTLSFRTVILMMHPGIIPLRTSMGPGRP
ncbi:hypothetical protein B0H11DRAFT_2032562 [Mycena galericulata]|nr:hypothetical protein B0H11DRAFT_2032562 [Mycena galericulata]